MERKVVQSSNIKSVGHDSKKKILEVEFLNGDIYQYTPFTSEGYRLFMNSESLGKFMHQFIRNNKEITTSKIS